MAIYLASSDRTCCPLRQDQEKSCGRDLCKAVPTSISFMHEQAAGALLQTPSGGCPHETVSRHVLPDSSVPQIGSQDLLIWVLPACQLEEKGEEIKYGHAQKPLQITRQAGFQYPRSKGQEH